MVVLEDVPQIHFDDEGGDDDDSVDLFDWKDWLDDPDSPASSDDSGYESCGVTAPSAGRLGEWKY